MSDWADEIINALIEEHKYEEVPQSRLAQALRQAYERGRIDEIEHKDATAYGRGVAEGIERVAEWIVDHHAIDPGHRKALSDAIRALKPQEQSDEG